jgi:NADH-quinone oxidoreductase subunit E
MTTQATTGDTDKKAIDQQFSDLLDHYKGERGALVPLLQGAQAIFGYLPEEVMRRWPRPLGNHSAKP